MKRLLLLLFAFFLVFLNITYGQDGLAKVAFANLGEDPQRPNFVPGSGQYIGAVNEVLAGNMGSGSGGVKLLKIKPRVPFVFDAADYERNSVKYTVIPQCGNDFTLLRTLKKSDFAWVVPVEQWNAFSDSIQQKLLSEISDLKSLVKDLKSLAEKNAATNAYLTNLIVDKILPWVEKTSESDNQNQPQTKASGMTTFEKALLYGGIATIVALVIYLIVDAHNPEEIRVVIEDNREGGGPAPPPNNKPIEWQRIWKNASSIASYAQKTVKEIRIGYAWGL